MSEQHHTIRLDITEHGKLYADACDRVGETKAATIIRELAALVEMHRRAEVAPKPEYDPGAVRELVEAVEGAVREFSDHQGSYHYDRLSAALSKLRGGK